MRSRAGGISPAEWGGPGARSHRASGAGSPIRPMRLPLAEGQWRTLQRVPSARHSTVRYSLMETMLTTTEFAVLGLLVDGERSGYDLSQQAARSVGYIWTPAKSQIYKVLPRLVARGLASRRDVVQAARPDKQLYRITRAGRATLRAWVEKVEPATEANRDAVLLKIFFGELVEPDVVAEHVEALRRHD